MESEDLRNNPEWSFCIENATEAGDVNDADNQRRKLELFNVNGFC